MKFIESTHAPLYGVYKNGRHKDLYRELKIAEKGEYAYADPETGAEFRALGGINHKYSTDLSVGSSYPKTMFVSLSEPLDQKDNEDKFSYLKMQLEDADLFNGPVLHRVLIPENIRTLDFSVAYQYAPPSRAPRLDRIQEMGGTRVGDRSVVLVQ